MGFLKLDLAKFRYTLGGSAEDQEWWLGDRSDEYANPQADRTRWALESFMVNGGDECPFRDEKAHPTWKDDFNTD